MDLSAPNVAIPKSGRFGQYYLNVQNVITRHRLQRGQSLKDTRKPLTMWFRAIWWVTSQKNGASALGLQRILGLKSYQTAWTWMHKLRTAMLRPGRDKLSGYVEVDETYLVSGDNRKQGRGAQEKSLIAVAV